MNWYAMWIGHIINYFQNVLLETKGILMTAVKGLLSLWFSALQCRMMMMVLLVSTTTLLYLVHCVKFVKVWCQIHFQLLDDEGHLFLQSSQRKDHISSTPFKNALKKKLLF